MLTASAADVRVESSGRRGQVEALGVGAMPVLIGAVVRGLRVVRVGRRRARRGGRVHGRVGARVELREAAGGRRVLAREHLLHLQTVGHVAREAGVEALFVTAERARLAFEANVLRVCKRKSRRIRTWSIEREKNGSASTYST